MELNTLSARNVHSVAEALMTLLDSYDEPVIPFEFYQRCLDASADAALSRQVRHCTPVYARCDSSGALYNPILAYINTGVAWFRNRVKKELFWWA